MDANSREYAAAVVGMADHTPAPLVLEKGDEVSGISDGVRWGGRVEWVNDDGELCVNGGGWWCYRRVADVVSVKRGAAR